MLQELVGRVEERVILLERHFPPGLEFAGVTRHSEIPMGFMLATDRFNGLIERCESDYGRYLGLATAVFAVLALVATYLLFVAGAILFSRLNPEPTKVHNPKNFLLLPGINDFLPWVAAGYILLAVIVAVFLHELGHAIVAVNNDIPVRRTGVITLFVLPIGAFVELDKEPDEIDDDYVLLKIAGAGLMMNLALGLLATAVYFATPAQIVDLLPPTPDEESAAAAAEFLETFMETTTSLPPLTQFVFWLGFLNLNFIVVNALPIRGFDGHFTLTSTLELGFNRWSLDYDAERTTRYVQYTAVLAIGVVVAGPYLWS